MNGNRICKDGMKLSKKLRILSEHADIAKRLKKENGFYGKQKSLFELNKEFENSKILKT